MLSLFRSLSIFLFQRQRHRKVDKKSLPDCEPRNHSHPWALIHYFTDQLHTRTHRQPSVHALFVKTPTGGLCPTGTTAFLSDPRARVLCPRIRGLRLGGQEKRFSRCGKPASGRPHAGAQRMSGTHRHPTSRPPRDAIGRMPCGACSSREYPQASEPSPRIHPDR